MIIFFSNTAGKIPSVAQLDRADSHLGYNIPDGKLYGLKNVGGTKSVVLLNGSGGGGDPYTHPAYTDVDETLSGAKVLATFKTDAIGSVTEVTTRDMTLSDIGAAGSIIDNTGTLSSSAWSNNSQTINVVGVTATNRIIVSPSATLNNIALYADAGIICSAQGNGTLTFVCVRQPISNISINILIL